LQHTTLTTRAAVLFPVVASIVLLTLFAFNYVQSILVVYMVFSSAAAVAFLGIPLFSPSSAGPSALTLTSWQLIRQYTGPCVVGAAVALAWAWSNNSWFFGNLLGVAFCVAMVSLIRLPSVKLSVIILCGLFIYDLFFVFLSPMLFGKNVMVEVATQKGDNPANTVVNAVESVLPVQLPEAVRPAIKLDPPNKLVFPIPQYHNFVDQRDGKVYSRWFIHAMMLGLGDLALPGLLIAFALSVQRHLLLGNNSEGAMTASQVPRATGDSRTSSSIFSYVVDRLIPVRRLWREVFRPHRPTATTTMSSFASGGQRQPQTEVPLFFRTVVIGYACGLAITFLVGRLFEAAQPALIYIVPSTLLPFIVHAKLASSSSPTVWELVWNGLPLPPAVPVAVEGGAEGDATKLLPSVAVVVPSVADVEDHDNGNDDLGASGVVQRRGGNGGGNTSIGE
jgi:Signal peptide peptidase